MCECGVSLSPPTVKCTVNRGRRHEFGGGVYLIVVWRIDIIDIKGRDDHEVRVAGSEELETSGANECSIVLRLLRTSHQCAKTTQHTHTGNPFD